MLLQVNAAKLFELPVSQGGQIGPFSRPPKSNGKKPAESDVLEDVSGCQSWYNVPGRGLE